MRLSIAVLCFCFVAGAAEIPAGAHVALQLVNAVDTRTAKVGDYVYLHTASPIAAGGHIVVPVGSYVQATVSRAQRSGRVSGRAELAIRIETLTFPDGREIRINPHLSSVDAAGSGQKVDAGEGDIKQASGHDSGGGPGTARPTPAPAAPPIMRTPSVWAPSPAPAPPSAASRRSRRSDRLAVGSPANRSAG